MRKSESIANLSAALVRAQKKIGAATKDSANPFFKSKYADLGAVMEACKEHLNNEGIAVLQPVSNDGTAHLVETVLIHESGEYIAEAMKLELKETDMQKLGSAVTYARRYGLQSMLFIPAEDDDGEKSMDRAPKSAPAQATTAAAPAAAPAAKANGFRRVGAVNPPVANGGF